MGAATSAPSSTCSSCTVVNLSRLSSHSSISPQFIYFPHGSFTKGVRWGKLRESGLIIKAEKEGKEYDTSPSWDEKPRFEILPGGRKVSLNEHDFLTYLYSPKELSLHNSAAYIWEKVSEIPEQRRLRLLDLMDRRHVQAAWEVAGARYDDEDLAKLSSSDLLLGEDEVVSVEFWKCRKTGGVLPLSLVRTLKKALFRKDGKAYGRLIGDSPLRRLATTFKPLYFTVKEANHVRPTGEPCDLAYDFGNGLPDLDDYPKGFPKPAKHPWPFNDHAAIYIRHVGPGVMVGQAWHGLAPDRVPGKICNEILMVKDYSSTSQ